MGAAPTIEEQSKKDAAFQQYINERNADLDKATAQAKTDMAGQIDAFYKAGGWGDQKPLASGAYQHLATTSTWSLDHIIGMIDAVRGAVFGGAPIAATAIDPTSKVPQPASATATQVSPMDDTTKALVAAMGGTELIIANAAFQVISGILAAFKSSIETDLVKTIKQKEVLPGLSLFVCVMENKYHRTDFFNDETIVQNFYIYDCRMSLSRAADLAKMDRIQGLYKQQLDLESQASSNSAEIGKMSLAAYKAKFPNSLASAVKAYKDDFALYESIISDINTQIETTAKKIEDMRNAKAATNAALVTAKRRELFMM